jgi:hypothetical protein
MEEAVRSRKGNATSTLCAGEVRTDGDRCQDCFWTAFDCFWLDGLACTGVPLPDRRMCAPLNFLTPVRKCL